MNETLKCIAERYSCRDFDGTPLTDAQVQALVEAALAAPSAMNRQPWHVIMITDKALIDEFDAAGMDPQYLKDSFGDEICFHGGISVQKTLPFGTVEDVKKEVIERIEVLGKNGGYILAPSHCIQAGTPPENVVAMFETAKNYSRK